MNTTARCINGDTPSRRHFSRPASCGYLKTSLYSAISISNHRAIKGPQQIAAAISKPEADTGEVGPEWNRALQVARAQGSCRPQRAHLVHSSTTGDARQFQLPGSQQSK